MKYLFLLLLAALLFGGCIFDSNNGNGKDLSDLIIGIWQNDKNQSESIVFRGMVRTKAMYSIGGLSTLW